MTLFFRSHGGHPSLSPFVSRTVSTVADAVETSDGLHSGLRNDDPDLLNQIYDLNYSGIDRDDSLTGTVQFLSIDKTIFLVSFFLSLSCKSRRTRNL